MNFKKIIVFPLYLLYYVFFEWILGFGVKDTWDDMKKWAER